MSKLLIWELLIYTLLGNAWAEVPFGNEAKVAGVQKIFIDSEKKVNKRRTLLQIEESNAMDGGPYCRNGKPKKMYKSGVLITARVVCLKGISDTVRAILMGDALRDTRVYYEKLSLIEKENFDFSGHLVMVFKENLKIHYSVKNK